jgi:peptide/nickel transport system substrate-binding protein
VTYAEQPGAAPNYIFWLTPGQDFSVANNDQFQYLMWRPLYVFGVGDKAQINYAWSIGNRPVYSNDDRTVTITLKHWIFSNGQPITARSVVFWMNLLKANKTDWGAYVPGEFPDNVVSTTAIGRYTVRFELNGSYNPTWFTYNELSQVVPLPMAWDRTSLGAPAPTASTPNLPDTTPSGARAVYRFLNAQATDLASYASSPIWSIVDGPWKLQSFTTTGRAVFVPNPRYSGPVKPSIKKFIELPFTSDESEFSVLASGHGLTYGYLPSTALAQQRRIEAEGYRVAPWTAFGWNYIPMNYNSPIYGPVYRQPYVREALQHLIDQPAWIRSFLGGYAVPTYS